MESLDDLHLAGGRPKVPRDEVVLFPQEPADDGRLVELLSVDLENWHLPEPEFCICLSTSGSYILYEDLSYSRRKFFYTSLLVSIRYKINKDQFS